MKLAQMLATHPLGMAFKTFLAVLLAAAVGDWATHGAISLGNWQTWVIAALVSALPVVVNYLNPADTRVGIHSQVESK